MLCQQPSTPVNSAPYLRGAVLSPLPCGRHTPCPRASFRGPQRAGDSRQLSLTPQNLRGFGISGRRVPPWHGYGSCRGRLAACPPVLSPRAPLKPGDERSESPGLFFPPRACLFSRRRHAEEKPRTPTARSLATAERSKMRRGPRVAHTPPSSGPGCPCGRPGSRTPEGRWGPGSRAPSVSRGPPRDRRSPGRASG